MPNGKAKITRARAIIVLALAEEPHQTVQELAEKLEKALNTIKSVLDRAKAAGYTANVAGKWYLTESGRSTVQQCEDVLGRKKISRYKEYKTSHEEKFDQIARELGGYQSGIQNNAN